MSNIKKITCAALFEVLNSDAKDAKVLTKGKVFLKGKQGDFSKAWNKLVQGIEKKLPNLQESTDYTMYWISHESPNSRIAMKNANQLEGMLYRIIRFYYWCA